MLIVFPPRPHFLSLPAKFPADGNGLNPLLQYPEDGDSSAYALSRLRRVHCARLLFALGALIHEVSRAKKWDPHHPPLDHGDLGLSYLRESFLRIALGRIRCWVGEVIGEWDPVENASLMPLAHGNCLFCIR